MHVNAIKQSNNKKIPRRRLKLVGSKIYRKNTTTKSIKKKNLLDTPTGVCEYVLFAA